MSLLLRTGILSSEAPDNTFKTTWNTENLGGTGSATKVILLPMSAGLPVDWGDGTVNNLNTHTYSTGGVKTVKIYGAVTGFRFANGGDRLKITDVGDVGGLVIDNNQMFYGCINTTWTTTNAPSITATNINNLFRNCSQFNGAIGNWDMSSVVNVLAMLRGTKFNQDVSSWDTSSMTNMNELFRSTQFDQDISNFDMSGVTNAANMLNGSAFSTANYDLLLPAWEAQAVQDNVSFHAGSAQYNAGAPATARAALIADHTWTITDGGAV